MGAKLNIVRTGCRLMAVVTSVLEAPGVGSPWSESGPWLGDGPLLGGAVAVMRPSLSAGPDPGDSDAGDMDDPFDDFEDDDFDDEFDDDFEEDWEDDLTQDEEFPDTFGGQEDEKKKEDGGKKSPFSDDPDFDKK